MVRAGHGLPCCLISHNPILDLTLDLWDPPESNEGDLEDVPEQVRSEMTFHLAETIDDVLALALESAPGVTNDKPDSKPNYAAA